MRTIDADELLEHVWRERLDSRERIANLVKSMPTIEPQRWIPVGEGKPKDGTDCLVTYSVSYGNNGIVEIATFAEDLYEVDEYNFRDKRGVAGWFYFDDEYGYLEYSGVIAWMPLPDSYKGG